MQQQIVEVDRVRLQQSRLIGRIDLGHHASQGIARTRLIVGGGDQIVLGPADRRGDPVGRVVRGVEAQIPERAPHRVAAVAGVVDRVVLGQPHVLSVLPQQPRAKTVKRAHPHRLAGGQHIQACPHLVGRLVRKGQGNDLPRRHPVPQQVGHAMGYHAGLAAPRSGQDQQRSVDVLDGGPLGVGQ